MALTKAKGHILADDLALAGNPTTTTQSASDNTTKLATTAYVTTAIANLADSAPSTLNTLNELAAALGDDANYSTTTTNAIAAKLPLAGGTLTGAVALNQTGSVNTVPLAITSNLNTGQSLLELRTTGNSPATIDLRADGTGDPRIFFDLNGATAFAIGVDNSDSDKFKISGNYQLGTNDRIVVDSSGKVGIGTASPAEKLEVSGGHIKITNAGNTNLYINANNSGSDSTVFFQEQGSAKAKVQYDSSNASLLLTDGAYADTMTLKGAKVGIGTTSPSYKLHTSGSDAIQAWFQSTHANTCQLQLSTATTNSYARITNNAGTLLYESDITADNANSGHQFKVDGAEKMRIDSNGKVNIGGTTMSQLLNIQTASSSVAPQIEFRNTAAGTQIGMPANTNALSIFTGDAERMRIDSSGKVGIGTTAPNANLHVGSSNATGDSANPAIQIGGTTTYRLGLYTDSEGAIIQNLNGDDGIQFRVKTAGEAMRIDGGTGKVGIGTTAPGVKLDVRGEIAVGYDATYGLRFYNQGRSNWSSIGNFATDTTADLNFKTGGGLTMTMTHAKNVGIGTSSPSARLHVKSAGTGNVLYVESSDGHHLGGFYQESDTRAAFNVRDAGGGVKVNLDAGGDSWFTGGEVGIGTTSPSAKLDVLSADATYALKLTSNQNTSGSYNGLSIAGYDENTGSYPLIIVGNSLTHETGGNPKFCVRADGKVGIGTVSPGGSLHVHKASGGNNTVLLTNSTNTAGTYTGLKWAYSSGDQSYGSGLIFRQVDTSHGGQLEFWTDNASGTYTQKMTLNEHGTLLAGLTTAVSYPGTITTARTGSSSTTTQNTWGGNFSATGGQKDYGIKVSGSGSYAFGVINYNETTWMSRLGFDGRIYLTNTTVGSISDRRLKENIVDANSQWNDIKALQFKNYTWKNTERGTGTYLGLIADEVKTVSPNLVEVEYATAETLPENGIDPEYEGVKYSIVWMKAVKALQEAMTRIETLEAEVAALKG